MKRRNSAIFWGGFIWRRAVVLAGCARTPSLLMICPRNLSRSFANSLVWVISVTTAASVHSSAAISRASCSSLVCPNTSTLSIRHRTPSSPWRILDILFWNSSGALDIPKGSLMKQYRPDGVMNVVRWQDSFSRGICQNPLLAQSLLKSVAPW